MTSYKFTLAMSNAACWQVCRLTCEGCSTDGCGAPLPEHPDNAMGYYISQQHHPQPT